MERRDPIEVKDHDPGWAKSFLAEAPAVQHALGHMAAGRVEHIGSTAVPGLAAKPIIDMLVAVRADIEADAVRSALVAIGWVHDPQPDDRQMRRVSFCRPDPAWAHTPSARRRRIARAVAGLDRLSRPAAYGPEAGERIR